MLTYQQMFDQRREWKAAPIRHTPFEFPDECLSQTIERIIALGLALELPVGAFVGEATKKELPISNDARKLLLSNITDETNHFRQLKFAESVYPVAETTFSIVDQICADWEEHPDHSLMKAGLCENGIFLASLAVLWVCGGESLANVSVAIARDEQRHVATNRACLRDAGYNLSKPSASLERLRHDTLDWVFDGFSIADLGIDKDWMVEQADLLVRDGVAPEMAELTSGANYTPDFETEARKLY